MSNNRLCAKRYNGPKPIRYEKYPKELCAKRYRIKLVIEINSLDLIDGWEFSIEHSNVSGANCIFLYENPFKIH